MWASGLIVTLGILFTALPAAAASDISIYINGWKVDSDVPPALVNDHTMVPIRFISEKLGADVDWQDPDIIIRKDDLKLQLTLNSKNAYKNGAAMEKLEAVPFLKKTGQWFRCVLLPRR